jgi:hypothetical protein
LGTVLIGFSLAILRLISDRAEYKRAQEIKRRKADQVADRSIEKKP